MYQDYGGIAPVDHPCCVEPGRRQVNKPASPAGLACLSRLAGLLRSDEHPIKGNADDAGLSATRPEPAAARKADGTSARLRLPHACIRSTGGLSLLRGTHLHAA